MHDKSRDNNDKIGIAQCLLFTSKMDEPPTNESL